MNLFCSIFSQLLKLFPRSEFDQLVRQTRAERHARGFACWDQFVAMLFCQLGRAQSLREICGGLASCEGKLVHLGISSPSRSTLAYANAHRPWQLYEAAFHRLLERCQELTAGAKRKFRFKNKLLSLDATVIDLCASVFSWAKYQRTKGAVKLHLLLDHDGYLPSVAVITEGKVADVRIARELRFEPGTILVFDRGYVDFAWFERLTAQGVFFVTRPKTGMAYQVVEHLVPPIDKNIFLDQIVELTSEQGEKIPWRFRRIEVYLPDKEETMALFTNHLDLSPVTIAGIYKERWQVELFFKALKQNLKIKTFVGTSANALRIQIWTALIAMLLLRYLQLRSTFSWSLSNLVALLRMNLFVHRDLWSWINQPFEKPPEIPETVQGVLALAP
ncbi:MAG: IS4 family transposase [Candidatus Binatia bacterium]